MYFEGANLLNPFNCNGTHWVNSQNFQDAIVGLRVVFHTHLYMFIHE